MTLTLVLPWFPILLSVGIGGRLLGRTRGLFLGVAAALFWVVLVQASAGYVIWREPWTIAAMFTGALAIAAMGAWSGRTPTAVSDSAVSAVTSMTPTTTPRVAAVCETPAHLQCLMDAMEQFDDWLERHGPGADPWPEFDELIGRICQQCCRATHVRAFRLIRDRQELVPLRSPQVGGALEAAAARCGLVGHVVTTGRSYFAGDPNHGELVDTLRSSSANLGGTRAAADTVATHALDKGESPAWAFAIRRGAARLGVVAAAQLGIGAQANRSLLRAVERLINQFWCRLEEAQFNRSVTQTDPVSGVLTRPAFFRLAEEAVAESYQKGDPVVVAILALEGLKEWSDFGHWEAVDELVLDVGRLLGKNARSEDRIGRLDDSRLVLLLRSVDSELAALRVSQWHSRVAVLCADEGRWPANVDARWGLAGSGTETPKLRELLVRALAQYQRARLEQIPLAHDLPPADSPASRRSDPQSAGV